MFTGGFTCAFKKRNRCTPVCKFKRASVCVRRVFYTRLKDVHIHRTGIVCFLDSFIFVTSRARHRLVLTLKILWKLRCKFNVTVSGPGCRENISVSPGPLSELTGKRKNLRKRITNKIQITEKTGYRTTGRRASIKGLTREMRGNG